MPEIYFTAAELLPVLRRSMVADLSYKKERTGLFTAITATKAAARAPGTLAMTWETWTTVRSALTVKQQGVSDASTLALATQIGSMIDTCEEIAAAPQQGAL
jgi:hypothetical protein